MKPILTRLALTLPVVWLVVSLVFLLIHLVPGDPIQQMLGEGATPTDTATLRHQYFLDLPLPQQYLRYWSGVLHGDLGNSIRLHDTVTHLIAARYPYTLALTLTALGLGLLLALPAGILAAVRRGRWLDQLLSVVSLFGLSVPGLALGPVLILVFSISLGWLPVSGANSGGSASIDWRYLVLPSIAMGASLAAILTRMVRTAMLEELGQDYIRTARAKGLERARRRLPPRAAQRAGPHHYRGGPAIRRAAGWGDCDRNYLQLARPRPSDGQRHLQSRLCFSAGLPAIDWADICAGESADGCGLSLGKSADAVREFLATRNLLK